MKITCINVSNYRNLDGLEVHLNPEMNFLVGDNELGKSNFLDLLDIVLNRRSFSRGDFFDENKPIEIKVSITLTDEEVGTFEDYFDPANQNQANFIAKQESVEEPLVYYRAENYETDPKEVSSAPFRRLNYIKYSSLRTPKDELGFDSERGVGKFLNYLIRSTLDRNGNKEDVLNSTVLEPIMRQINNTFGKIKPLQKMGIGTFADQEHQADLLARVLLLKNGDAFDIQKSGQGIQFSILLILSILEKLIGLKTSRWWKENIFVAPKQTVEKVEIESFLQRENKTWDDIHALVTVEGEAGSFNAENLTVPDEIGNKLKRLFELKGATIILGLDEPEIHLHPYMQRSLIKYIAKILKNKDEDFSSLLYDLLDLDVVSGQAIVVSHSPNILLDDYKQIVRFYKNNGSIKSISGCELNFDPQLEKHLLYQFSSIKEAFFSKCVVVVEGKTEMGAMSVWKDTYLGDADDLGISIIGADGCSSVRPIVKLLNELKIPNVSIMDRDDNNPATYADVPGLFFTNGRDFEEDLFDEVSSRQPECEGLFNILSYKEGNLSTSRQTDLLKIFAKKYEIAETWDTTVSSYQFSNEGIKKDHGLLKTMFIAFMQWCKSLGFGRFLALRIEWVPSIYCTVWDEAKKKAEMVK